MLTVAEIKKITRGRLLQGERSARIKDVSIDSRSVRKRNVFIAIKGNRLNGHQFIRKAIQKGAVALIVSQKIICSEDIAVIRVADTTKALGRIAAWYRQQFSIPVIAVTGSAGKTTTKELIAAVLSTRYKVLKNIKTENNQFGVPLTLLKLDASHQIAVLELGTNQKGEIATLAKIVRPTCVVLTNIGESHLAGLKNPQGVYREKVQLINYMSPGGTVIYNSDDLFLKDIRSNKGRRALCSFGVGADARIRANQIRAQNNHKLQFTVRNQPFMINSPALHNVFNALAAISCGLHYKIRYNEIRGVLARFYFRNSRQHVVKKGGYWLIDDTYNANPISLNSAVRTLDTLAIRGKRIIVCADMLELGARSVTLHRTAGQLIARSEADVVLTVGAYSKHITESCNRANTNVKATHCRDLREVHRRLKGLTRPGDAVLVKGSRGMRMERTVAYLKNQFK